MFVPAPPSRLSGLSRNRRPRSFRPVIHVRHIHSGLHMGEVSPPFKAPKGYKWEYEIDGLSGLGRFKLKSIVRAVTAPIRAVAKASQKIVKTVAKTAKKAIKNKYFKYAAIAYGGYLMYANAPWFQSLAKKIGSSAAKLLVQKHAPEIPTTNDEISRADTETTSDQMPDWISGPAQAIVDSKLAAQIAKQRAQQAAQADADTEISPQTRQAANQASGETPGWILPAAIGGAALLLMTTLS